MEDSPASPTQGQALSLLRMGPLIPTPKCLLIVLSSPGCPLFFAPVCFAS